MVHQGQIAKREIENMRVTTTFSLAGQFFEHEGKRFFKQQETTSPVLGRVYNAVCLGPSELDVDERYYFESEDEVEVINVA